MDFFAKNFTVRFFVVLFVLPFLSFGFGGSRFCSSCLVVDRDCIDLNPFVGILLYCFPCMSEHGNA